MRPITASNDLEDRENRASCVAELDRATGLGGGAAALTAWAERWGEPIRAVLLDMPEAGDELGDEP